MTKEEKFMQEAIALSQKECKMMKAALLDALL